MRIIIPLICTALSTYFIAYGFIQNSEKLLILGIVAICVGIAARPKD